MEELKEKENLENDKSLISGNNEKKMRLWLIISAVFFCFSILLLILTLNFIESKQGNSGSIKKLNPENNFKEPIGEEQAVNLARRLIDGVYVPEGDEVFYPVAVVIENHVDSRPSSGLARANLVFEAEAEGAVTRFLAVYADGADIAEIGPVRSARPYYADWAHEFNAVFSHCGGSPEALAQIIDEGIIDMNQFYNGRYFWRDQARYAPHNVYTSSANLKKFIEDKTLSEVEYLSWQYKDDSDSGQRPATSSIEIGYRSKDFAVRWEYDNASNTYIRYMAGELHKDKSGELIKAKNIVIMHTYVLDIDEMARLTMPTTGSGKAIICLDGKCENGKWRKESKKDRTRFYTAAAYNNDIEKEAEFNAGTTWVEVVREDYQIAY